MLPSIEELFAIERRHLEKYSALPPSVSDWHLTDIQPSVPAFSIPPSKDTSYDLSEYLFSDSREDEEQLILRHLEERYGLTQGGLGVSIFTNTTAALFSLITHLAKDRSLRALVQSPFYFSIASAFRYSAIEGVYFHTTSRDDFVFDSQRFVDAASDQRVDIAILTDPVYGAGASNTPEILRAVEALSTRNIPCIIDGSAGGLNSATDNHILVPAYLNAVRAFQNVFYVDSPTKRMLINSAKHALIFGSSATLRNLEGIADHIVGSLAREQLQILVATFSEENQSAIATAARANADLINRGYSFLTAACEEHSSLKVSKRSAGMYALVSRTDIAQRDVDPNEFYKRMIERNEVRIIPGHFFGVADTDGLAIRVNLLRHPSIVTRAVRAFSEFNL